MTSSTDTPYLHNSQRRAFTLIELTTVLGVMGIVMAVAATLLISLQRSNSRVAVASEAAVSRVDVGRQFRRDVHLATAVASDDPNQLTLTTTDGPIQYIWEAGSLTRSINETQQRYDTDNYKVRFSTTASLARLSAHSASSRRAPPWKVDAAIGVTLKQAGEQ